MKYIMIALLALAFLAPGRASARDNTLSLPEGLGHPPQHHEFFDKDCCNQQDCEMVPDTAVQETKGGWNIRFWTTKHGGMVVEGFVPRGQERMSKRCQDGFCIGVCSVPQYTSGGANMHYGPNYDYTKPSQVRCLYILPSA